MKPTTLVRAGLLTGISDGLFATVLSVFFFNSTFMRLWQGVAVVPFGRSMMDGGAASMFVGLGLHFCVAFFWSAVFLFGVMRLDWARRMLASPYGVAKMAALYGPPIWLVMSLVVIPVLLKRPPSITVRWWVQFIGHVPFVGLPIAWVAAAAARGPGGASW